MLNDDRGIYRIAERSANLVSDIEVKLVFALFKEFQVVGKTLGGACVVDTEIEGSTVCVYHAADHLHDVERLLFDIRTHIVVWREHD